MVQVFLPHSVLIIVNNDNNDNKKLDNNEKTMKTIII